MGSNVRQRDGWRYSIDQSKLLGIVTTHELTYQNTWSIAERQPTSAGRTESHASVPYVSYIVRIFSFCSSMMWVEILDRPIKIGGQYPKDNRLAHDACADQSKDFVNRRKETDTHTMHVLTNQKTWLKAERKSTRTRCKC